MTGTLQKGIALSIVASLTGVISNTSVKYIGLDFSPVSQTFFRTFIALLCIFIIFRKKISLKSLKNISIKELIVLLAIGVIGSTSAFYFLTLANITTSLANVAIVKSPQPLFIFLLAIPILKEKFSYKLLILLLLSVYGVIIVSTKSFIPSLSSWGKGEIYALISTFCFGLGFVGRKLLTNSKLSSVEISFWTLAISTLALAALGILEGSLTTVGSINSTIIFAMTLGGLMIALTVYLNNESLRYVTATLAGQLRLIEIIFSVFIGLILFSEFPNIYSIIGGTLIAITVYFSTLLHKSK